MAGPNFAFCLVIVFLTGELSAILDDHCTDLSYYEEIQYITKPKECCKPKLQHFCEDKREEVCKDVLEVQCEPQTRVECQSQTSLADGKKCEAEFKRYDYKDCNKKVTTRVDCRQNSVDSCKPKLKLYDDGRAVLTDELTCTPLLYEDCVVVDDAVPGCSRKELKTLCACPHDYIPVCAGDRLYDNLCLYECAKKEAKCADVEGIPALGDVAGCVAPDTKGIVNRDAIKEFKTTLLDIENELANLENSLSRRNGLGFTEDEFNFLLSKVEGKTYLEVECSDEGGQCDVEKINGFIEKSKSTFNLVKATGRVSSGFLPHFVVEREKFDEVADVAAKVQEKSATKRAPQETIPYLVNVVVELDITLGRSAKDSRRLLSSRADSALPPGCTAPFQVKWTDFVEKDKTVVEQTSFCEVKRNVECKPVSVKKCTFLDWKECSLRPVQECQTVSVSQPSQEKVHQKKCLKIDKSKIPTSTATPHTECPQEKGFCVLPNGEEQNAGLIKLNDVNGDTPEQHEKCFSMCVSHPGATGCEVIWNDDDRGCYVHTQEVVEGSGDNNVACWIFSKCRECPEERGYCVLPNAKDQNSGVIKLNDVHEDTPEHKEKCLSQCASHPGATGCEVIWNEVDRGCYVHTQEVGGGSGDSNHACWIFSKCRVGVNGEEVCEGHGYDEMTCAAIGCCHFDDGQCLSSVGQQPCGTSACPVAKLDFSTANAISNTPMDSVTVTLYRDSVFVFQVITDESGLGQFLSPHGEVALTAVRDGFAMAPVTLTIAEGECEKKTRLSLIPDYTGPARVVMSWGTDPKIMDLHVKQLKGGQTVCHFYFDNTNCGGVSLASAKWTEFGGDNGAETITFPQFEAGSEYMVFVDDFDKTDISSSEARVAIYRKGYEPLQLRVPTNGNGEDSFWLVGCLNSEGEFVSYSRLMSSEPTQCPSLQAKLDNYCKDVVQHEHEDCNGRVFARYGLDEMGAKKAWRCYNDLKEGTVAEACIKDHAGSFADLKQCQEPDASQGKFCTKDQEIKDIISEAVGR